MTPVYPKATSSCGGPKIGKLRAAICVNAGYSILEG
jgi:hypothetical protein